MRFPPLRWQVLLSLLAAVVLGDAALHAQTDGGTARASYVFSTALNLCVSSPTVAADGTVYWGSRDNTLLATGGKVRALTAANVARTFDTSDWVDAAPAIGPDGTLYVGCWNGKFYALKDPGTGAALTKVWEYAAGSFINSSAALGRDGTIYFGSGDSNLHALRPDGTLKWKFAAADWIDSAPSVAPNGDVVFGSWDRSVYAVNVEGVQRWSYATGGAVLASPAIASDGTVYVGSTDDRLYAFASNGALKWSYQTGADIEGSAAVGADGTVYFGSNDGYLYAVRADGTLRWRLQLGAAIAGGVALRADGSIVVGGTSFANAATPGFIAAVNPDGSLKWRNLVDDIVDASPAIGADNRIYFTTYGRRLYTLSGTSGLATAAPWPKFRRDAAHHGRAPADRTLANVLGLSIRAQVGTGSDVLIPGVVTSGAAKTLIVRALGPQLGTYGVSGTIPTTTMTLFRFVNGTPVAEQSNTGWSSVPAEIAPLQSAAAALGLDGLPPGSADSAMLSTLTPGAYTVQVGGLAGATGNALVQVYDTQLGTGGRLEAISSRALVGTGDKILIAGITIVGTGAKTLLIRGVGPKLTEFGVGGALAQPDLALFRIGGVGAPVALETNGGWPAAPNAAWIKAAAADVNTFALPDGSRDAGLLVTLLPGNYTAQVSGAGGSTGVALIEMVDVP